VHLHGATHNGEQAWRHQKLDKTIIDVAIYSHALSYDGHRAVLVASIDCTDRKRAEDELRRTKIFLDAVVEHVPLPIIVKDVIGLETDARGSRFTLFNRAYEELTGESRIQLIGKTAHQLFPKERADLIARSDNETLQSEQAVTTSEHPIITSHNGTRLVKAKKTVIRDETGQPQYLLTVIDDVTERRRAEQRIMHMAHYDPLTDLPNRATFNDTMDATLDRAGASREQFAILSIDLDHFKDANDTHGHLVGDALLREVAGRLQSAGEGAFLARVGGDEFAVILADGEQPAAAAALAERLLATFVEDFEVEGHQLKLGMSIGVAIYPTDGTNAKTLITNADVALYRAKAETRGTALFYEPEMGARLRERHTLQEDLKLAIDGGELLLHYQPQLTMSGEAVGFEALVRWQCPKHGLVSPGTFIPIAEASSLIIPIGEWVLREACREAASWSQPLTIAVNISPFQFHQGNLPRLVHSILLETGLAPARLELEITENVMINDFSRAVSILNQLKSLGVRIAMDDFGTGYSSLSYLQSFRCDKIKIDRIFICDLESNFHSRAIVRAVVGLGQSLDLPILAEGVETEAQHSYLVQEGCDEVQGYLTGRPLPIADYAKLVGRQAIAEQNSAVAG
jgi:diguanylate cyclase (GGDEF)-like protein/PAS domain S-box-containing protein